MAATCNCPIDSSQRVGDHSKETTKQLDMLQKRDQPCDVTMVVKDGKQFKAHGNVLSGASPFFETIIDGYWKESRERVIRLELLTEETMRDILEFVYSGSVNVASMERAEDLIIAADYLFLPNLKDIAWRFFEQTLSTSNCISIYNITKRLKIYRCEELFVNVEKFVYLHFTSVTKEEEFLNLPNHEVEQWISSDDIHVSAEDDVFHIILKWIERDKNERKKNFEDLFRHVRLPFVSHDCLLNEVSTNDFVKQNELCLNGVKYTLGWINVPSDDVDLSLQCPRKVLQTEALAVYAKKQLWFYLPGEDKWHRVRGMPRLQSVGQWLLSFRNKVYVVGSSLLDDDNLDVPLCYDPFLNHWTKLTDWTKPENLSVEKLRDVSSFRLVAMAGEEIYAVVTDFYKCENRETLLLKYNFYFNSWAIVPFDWGSKDGVCLILADRYLYTIGGYCSCKEACLTEAARFDIIGNRWKSIADIQQARSSAFGAVVQENIFIAGGFVSSAKKLQTCEMYNSSTNEWHFIANLMIPRANWARMVCVNGILYVLGGSRVSMARSEVIVECYDSEKREWRQKTSLPFSRDLQLWISACPLRIFKGALDKLTQRGTRKKAP